MYDLLMAGINDALLQSSWAGQEGIIIKHSEFLPQPKGSAWLVGLFVV